MMIGDQYVGSPRTVLGGYLCGLAARELGPSAEVRLRRPLNPRDDVTIERTGDKVVIVKGGDVVAEGAAITLSLELPAPLSYDEAQRIADTCPARERHAMPMCFGCGCARKEGEGLRIFTGWDAERNLGAATWTPHPAFADEQGVVRSEVVWAATDCPALWGLMLSTPADSDACVLTGAIATNIVAPIHAGKRYVILAWPAGGSGRTLLAGAAIYSEDGQLVASARQTCVRVEQGIPLGRNTWSKLLR